MPDWKMHLRSVEKLLPTFTVVNKEDFKIGAIIPDAPWIELGDYGRTDTLKYKLHYYIPRVGNMSIISNYFKFLKENDKFIEETDIGKGMLLHMILDAVINTNFNQVAKETSPGEFDIELYSGDVIHVSDTLEKIEMFYADMHSFEDDFSVGYIYDTRLSGQAKQYIWDLGCRLPAVDLVININNHIDRVYNTRNKIFNIYQYDKMIDDAIEIFLSIAESEGWQRVF